jgi:sporulation protein YlmC with PRC-barrel domain
MKNKLSCISACLAVGVATALANPEDQNLSSTATSSSSQASGSEQSMSHRPSTLTTSQVLFRANKLIGRDVSTPQGHKVGKLEEIVFHPKVGVFGLVTLQNDRMAPIPWTLVTAVTPDALVINTTMESINSGPTINDEEWTSFNSPQFTQRITSHYRQSQSQDTAQGGASLEDESSTEQGTDSSTISPSIDTNNVPAPSSLADTNTPSSLSSTNSPLSSTNSPFGQDE